MVEKVSLVGFDPIAFFTKIDAVSPAYFTSGEWVVIAWDPTETFVIKTVSDLQKAKKSASKRRSKDDESIPFSGGLIGYLSYDLGFELQGIRSTSRDRHRLPLGVLHRYEQGVAWNGKDAFVFGDRSFIDVVEKIHARIMPAIRMPDLKWKASISKKKFMSDFHRIQRDIRNGEYYQLNRTYAYESAFRENPRLLFAGLLKKNPAPCASYIEHEGMAILSLSPERFVTIADGRITTSPIKGTRPRGKTPAHDQRLSKDLLKSEKEAAELNMITDLLRNDIGKVSEPGSVRVTAHRALQKNPSVWHTYSTIEGRFSPSVSPFDAFLSMCPGGSITGCPKVAAMLAIDEIEKVRRGPYCGSMIMLGDDGRMDSTILIRTLVAAHRCLSLGVGGGIVADSKAKDEWDETIAKASTFITPFTRYWIDGKEVAATDRRLDALDPAYPRVRGVFETMVLRDGKIQNVKLHMKRLQRSASIIGMRLPRSIPWIMKHLQTTVSSSRDASLRLKFACTDRHVFLEHRLLFIGPREAHGTFVSIAPHTRHYPAAKHMPTHREWRIYKKGQKEGHGDVLLELPDGSIPEGSISNLFWVKKGIVHTANEEMLPGIMRSIVLKLVRSKNIPIRYTSPMREDLYAADEVFLTRSTVGVVPVLRIHQKSIGNGAKGKITALLQSML